MSTTRARFFADFDAMREINPLGRIPSLILDDGEVLLGSAAILVTHRLPPTHRI
jgi:glutathione S-transferase